MPVFLAACARATSYSVLGRRLSSSRKTSPVEFVRRVRRRVEKLLNTGNAVRLKNIIGILQAALLAEHAGRALRHQDIDALPHQAGDAAPQAVIGVRASRIPIADNDDFLDAYGQPGLANGRDTKCRDNRLRHGHADAQGILRAFREVEARVLIVAEADEPFAGPIVWATMRDASRDARACR